jgi:hypothetical protein
MSREREAEIEKTLVSLKETDVVKLFVELFALRREGYRDKLEKRMGDEFSGRALECRDLLQIFD